MRHVALILITASLPASRSGSVLITSDSPKCLETGSQRTEASFIRIRGVDIFFLQFWDNESQECVQCSPCTDEFEIRIPCSMFEDATCQDSSDKSLLDNTFGQKVVQIKSDFKYLFFEFTDSWHHYL